MDSWHSNDMSYILRMISLTVLFANKTFILIEISILNQTRESDWKQLKMNGETFDNNQVHKFDNLLNRKYG